MKEDVRICVSSRVDFFEKYYDIPPAMQGAVASFVAETEALGESCADAGEFEARFVSVGLSQRFNDILPKCTPKAVPVTQEQKAYSRQVRRELWNEQKGQIVQDILDDVTESAAMRIESDATQARNRAMSEAGVLDEYTRVSNVVDDVKYGAKLFSKLFKKK